MSDEDPQTQDLGDRTLQRKKDRINERKTAAVALIAALIMVLIGAVVGLIFLLRQNQAISQLGASVDVLRSQQEYCSQPKVTKTDPQCQEPAAPPAKEIIGKQGVPGGQGVQGIQGPPGPQGIQGPPGIQGVRGLPGSSPACLLEPSRCIGATGQPGAVSTVPGPKGEEGKPGADSTVAGPQGEQGKPGADSTVAGPEGQAGKPGADSTVPGPQGKQGPPGPDCPTGSTLQKQQVVTTEAPLGIWVVACVLDDQNP